MTARSTDRLLPLIEKAARLAAEQGGLKAVSCLPQANSSRLSEAIERGLISPSENRTEDSFQAMISETVSDGTQLIITDRATLTKNSAWLHDPAHQFVKRGILLNRIALLDIPAYDKLLLLGNCFGSDRPDLPAKLKTAELMIKTGRAVGLDQPKIAVLAAVEVVYPQMTATCDGAVLAKMSDRGQIKSGLVDGPLSLDVAIDSEVARSKGVTGSSVAGQADGFLAPDPETARGIWEVAVKFASADFASVILGGRLPIISLLPSGSSATLLNSVALARLLA